MYSNTGGCYAVKFGNGIIKVGRAKDLKKRLGSYKSQAKMMETTIESTYTRELKNQHFVELRILRYCIANGSIIFGKEYFRGLDFLAVCAYIEALDDVGRLPGEHLTRADLSNVW